MERLVKQALSYKLLFNSKDLPAVCVIINTNVLETIESDSWYVQISRREHIDDTDMTKTSLSYHLPQLEINAGQ